eukprot:scaffold16905_cov58-Phaeocystis_antarctica.AAC.3
MWCGMLWGSVVGVCIRARHLVLGVEAITPVQLGQHLLRLAHRLERAARRLGIGAANIVGLDDSGGGREVQGRAVVDLEAAEEAEGRAHGTAAFGARVLDRGAAELVPLCDIGELWVRLEHGAQELGGDRLFREQMQRARIVAEQLQRPREGFAIAEIERGERAQPAHLDRQRREGCAAEGERGEREHPAHLGRQLREGLAVGQVERGERAQPAHLGRQRREG